MRPWILDMRLDIRCKVTVTVRLQRTRRTAGVLLAIITLAAAALATFHTHVGDGAECQLGLAPRVPVSVITDPDSPSSAYHLHAGLTLQGDTCQACVLSTAQGMAPGTLAAPAASPVQKVAVLLCQHPDAPAPSRHRSRSPPTSA